MAGNSEPGAVCAIPGAQPATPSAQSPPGTAHGAGLLLPLPHRHQRIVAICGKAFGCARVGETHGLTTCSSRPQSQRHQSQSKVEVTVRVLERESCVSVVHQGAEPCKTGCDAPCRRLRRGQARRAGIDQSKGSRTSRHKLRWTNGNPSKSTLKQASTRPSHQCAQSGFQLVIRTEDPLSRLIGRYFQAFRGG